MKIRSIDSLGLFGKSPKGGWTNEIKAEDSVHALVIVKTDDGPMGVGSVFTDARLVEAALAVLRPLVIGESAVEPMRVTEKLHQNTFWMGHGGTLTHTISGIDIALWDIFGQVCGQPIGRLLGGSYRDQGQSLCLDPDGAARANAGADRPLPCARASARSRLAGARSAASRRRSTRRSSERRARAPATTAC